MSQVYEFGDFRLETAERRLFRQGVPVAMAPRVFDTLVLLVENSGRLLSKDELMQKLWPDTFVEEVSLSQNISQLRKALGGMDSEPMIQTVAKRGYRFAAAVRTVAEELPPGRATRDVSETGQLASRELPPERSHRGWKIAAAMLVFVGAIAVGLVVWSRRETAKASAAPTIHSIAVLPLANLSADSEQEFFADGITDDLITELARIHALRVISRTSVMQYKGTRKSLPEIARELNVDALVEGTVSQLGGRLHITAQLVQAIPEQHIWAESYERPLAEAHILQTEIAREIAGALRAAMTPEEQARMRRSRAVNAPANLAYLKGQYFWNKRTPAGVREGEKYFFEAMAQDPDFSQAYVGLADAYIMEGGWGMEPATVVLPKAEAAARHALALDPDNADAHAALGLIAMNYDWDWSKSEREYKQALALSPNDALAHHWYAEFLVARGRFDEALAEIQRAQELDPLSLVIAADWGKLLYFNRRYDDAAAQLQKALKMDPSFLPAHGWLVKVYAAQRLAPQADEALRGLEKANPDSASYWSAVSVVKGATGRQKEVQAAAKVLDRSRPQDPSIMLFLPIAKGDTTEAFAWMEKCYTTHSTVMTSLKVSPDYDTLRNDPRFATYLSRVGLSD